MLVLPFCKLYLIPCTFFDLVPISADRALLGIFICFLSVVGSIAYRGYTQHRHIQSHIAFIALVAAILHLKYIYIETTEEVTSRLEADGLVVGAIVANPNVTMLTIFAFWWLLLVGIMMVVGNP